MPLRKAKVTGKILLYKEDRKGPPWLNLTGTSHPKNRRNAQVKRTKGHEDGRSTPSQLPVAWDPASRGPGPRTRSDPAPWSSTPLSLAYVPPPRARSPHPVRDPAVPELRLPALTKTPPPEHLLPTLTKTPPPKRRGRTRTCSSVPEADCEGNSGAVLGKIAARGAPSPLPWKVEGSGARPRSAWGGRSGDHRIRQPRGRDLLVFSHRSRWAPPGGLR